jgi:hypothetical protein
MACQPVRIALLLGAISAVTVSPARADNCAPACTQPCTRTIQVTECVPETYKVKRTVYRTECKTEEVEGFRCEMVPETKERTVTCIKRVPVMKTETRKVCKTVTEYEERCVMKTCYKTVQETCMKKKLVRAGHWECETVCKTDFMACLHNRFNKCCDPCDPCCSKQPETRTVTRKKWVCCPEYQECPVTVCKKVPYQVPTTCRVPVCRQVWSECQVNVCTYQCIPETRVEKYTVCVAHKVPCKYTRTVRVCVPHEEEVTCTRMVARTVTREVPVNACETTCCSSGGARGLFTRFHRSSDCGCCR